MAADDTNPYSPPQTTDAGACPEQAPRQPRTLSQHISVGILGCMAIFITPIVGLFSFAAGGAAIRTALGDNAGVDTVALVSECLSGLIGMGLTIFIFVKLAIAVKPLPDEVKPAPSSVEQ